MILKLLQESVGGIQVLQRHKNIYTAIVHTDQPLNTNLEEFDTQIIKMVEETPKFPLDFQLFSFTKTFCDAEFTTGNQILQFNDVVWPKLFRNNKEFQEIKGQEELNRKNFVISKKITTQQILNHPFFSIPSYTNFITKNQFIKEENLTNNQSFKSKNNTIVQDFENFSNAAKYFRQLVGDDQKIFYDIGPQFLYQILDQLDLYIITIYSGLLDQKFRVGQMPNFKDVMQHMRLTYKSEMFEQNEGHIQFFVFEK